LAGSARSDPVSESIWLETCILVSISHDSATGMVGTPDHRELDPLASLTQELPVLPTLPPPNLIHMPICVVLVFAVGQWLILRSFRMFKLV